MYKLPWVWQSAIYKNWPPHILPVFNIILINARTARITLTKIKSNGLDLLLASGIPTRPNPEGFQASLIT
jgi:hypothetical protein